MTHLLFHLETVLEVYFVFIITEILYIHSLNQLKLMKTIEVQVKEELIELIGREALVQYLQKQAEAYEMIPIIEDLSESIQKSKMDFESELKKAKQQAWQVHKQERYPNLK